MVKYKIKKVLAREMLDSRGNPTVEVTASTQDEWTSVLVPSGASTGIHEALELRDGDKKRYHGKGVLKACDNVNKKISRKLTGMDVRKQLEIDEAMIHLDRTFNKSKLGANAILGASMAITKLAAKVLKVPLYEYIHTLSAVKTKMIMPVPCMNIINGGKHAEGKLDIQEFMLLPTGAKSFKEAVQIGSEIYHVLKEKIGKKYGKVSTHVGDEGGFAPSIDDIHEPFALILDSAQELGYKSKVRVAMDAAASEFYNKKNQKYRLEGKEYMGMELVNIYKYLAKQYPLISIEDPFDQDDYKNFYVLTQEIGKKVQIVGDDFLVTNPGRIKKAVNTETCNALLLKVNQIGSITESLDAAAIALDNKWNVMVSHRSGETGDTFIADLAVGLGSGQIKAGAPCRGERTAKYNQLMRIEEAGKFKYAGIKAFST